MGGVHTVAVHAPQSPSAGLNARIFHDSLEKTYQEVVASGKRVRGLLLTNPSNPLGLIFTEETMKMSVDWARSHGLHIIVDEIYALSTFGDKQTEVAEGFAQSFRSVVSVLGNQLDNDVHVLWSLSKDFGGSGLRLGVVYSQNKDLIRVLGASNDAFQVSNVIQEIAGHLLSDFDFVDNYLATNSQRLSESFQIVKQGLEAINVKVMPANAGIFAYIDMRVLMKEETFEEERRLFSRIVDVGVVVTPGESCHCPIPGHFRMCYAWMPKESLAEAIRRIVTLAAQE